MLRRTRSFRCALAATLLFAGACAADEPEPLDTAACGDKAAIAERLKPCLDAETREACEAQDGTWFSGPWGEFCDCRTGQAACACISDAPCVGHCLAPFVDSCYKAEVGHCTEYVRPGGCWCWIGGSDGTSTGKACWD